MLDLRGLAPRLLNPLLEISSDEVRPRFEFNLKCVRYFPRASTTPKSSDSKAFGFQSLEDLKYQGFGTLRPHFGDTWDVESCIEHTQGHRTSFQAQAHTTMSVPVGQMLHV